MAHRLALEAEADLDDIWYFIASQSGNPEVADRFIDSLSARFLLLARHPHLGRRRDDDLLPGLRSFPLGRYVILYSVESDGDVLIVRVIPGERDIPTIIRS
jgi:toxin ParE1/3/4